MPRPIWKSHCIHGFTPQTVTYAYFSDCTNTCFRAAEAHATIICALTRPGSHSIVFHSWAYCISLSHNAANSV